MQRTFGRFLKYLVVGVSTFVLDLFLLYVLTDFFLINYLISAGIAFAIAASINYYFSRKFIFKKTLRKADHGYYAFLFIAGIGLFFVVILMAFLVEILSFNYILSRVLVAGFVGMWNYLMNLYVNFKVAGNH
jgi:putative flippase GtrA